MVEESRPVELPDDYYLSNFHALAGFVFDTYHDLLSDEERQWYEKLKSSTISAQRLYVRLLMRRGPLFRISRLSYSEIDNIENAAQMLSDCGLAFIEAPSAIEDLLPVFTKPELIKSLSLGPLKSKSRAALVDHIINLEDAERVDAVRCLQVADNWIAPRGHGVWNLYTLCFFGNLYQDTTEFVLRDLGTIEYESYEIDKDFRFFQSRSQIDAHMRYFECSALWETIDKKSLSQMQNILELCPAPVKGDIHLSRRLDRFRNSVGRQMERLGFIDEALDVFALSSRPPARERQVRIYLSKDDVDSAQVVLASMLSAPTTEGEQQVALRLEKQIAKRLGKPAQATPRFRPSTSSLTLVQTTDRVERVAQLFYSRLGTCNYCENQLVNGVLGLFIWDIVFHAIPHAFFNPFQSGPSDFYTAGFAKNRERLLEKRFKELDDPLRFSSRIMQNYETHFGKANPLVRWNGFNYDLLSIALQRIPSDHWRIMFHRILVDPRENMTGFPDLVLFRNDDENYEFIEIKGPGDTVQKNQLRWMEQFSLHRIPYRVVNVRWAMSATQHEES